MGPSFVLHRLLVAAGAVAALFSGWVCVNAAGAILGAPSEAPAHAPGSAPERTWVRLEGVTLDCASRSVRGGATFFVGTPSDGSPPLLVQLVGDVPCEGATLDGGFAPGSFTRRFLEEKAGVELPEGPNLRVFTQALAPRYQKQVIWRTLPWLGLGVLLAWLGLRGQRRARQGSARR